MSIDGMTEADDLSHGRFRAERMDKMPRLACVSFLRFLEIEKSLSSFRT